MVQEAILRIHAKKLSKMFIEIRAPLTGPKRRITTFYSFSRIQAPYEVLLDIIKGTQEEQINQVKQVNNQKDES